MGRYSEIEVYRRAYDDPDYGMGVRRKAHVQKILENLRPGSLLDIGTGRGEALDMAEKAGHDPVIGTEVVKELLGDRIVYGEAHSLPFATGDFDYVTCWDVLEHLVEADIRPCLTEMYRVAKQCCIVSASETSSIYNGRELHISRRPKDQWLELIKECWPGAYEFGTAGRSPAFRADKKCVPKLFNDLILQHAGKRIAVLGGAPSLESDLQRMEADIYISANDWGIRNRPCDYIISMDEEHVRDGVNHGKLRPHLRKYSNAPIIGPWPFNDYQLTWWPGVPRKMLSGLVGVWCAWAMGGHPVILAGFNSYSGKEDARGKARMFKDHIKGDIRQVSGMDEFWPRYDPDEVFAEYVPHSSIRGLLGIEEVITIEVRKPTLIRGVELPKGTCLQVARHEVRKLLRHRMVVEV